jgi:polyhydroxyalkanoate synthesis repressor PhaR
MSETPDSKQLLIKKYPNRRLYDATRSKHVTSTEIYDLIADGYEVTVTDSKTGSDITSAILTQIILDRDAPKLDMFPASLLHEVIRANQHMLRGFFDQYVTGAFEAFRASQSQFDSFLRSTMGLNGPTLNPLEWTKSMFNPFQPKQSPTPQPNDAPPVDAEFIDDPVADDEDQPDSLNEMKEQIARLSAEVNRLKKEKPAKPKSDPKTKKTTKKTTKKKKK